MKDDTRRPPDPPDPDSIPAAYKEDRFAQERPHNGNGRASQLITKNGSRAPIRAIQIKGDQLRANLYKADVIDWSDIYNRYVDLWQEARLTIWRAKRSKTGIKTFDPESGKDVLSFICDDKLVLDAITVVRGVLDSMVHLRSNMMKSEGIGIPRWAIKRIEMALHDHPEARDAILTRLAEGEGEEEN